MAVAVAELQPDPKNARKHDRRNLDAIKASLEKFGFRQPIVVQKQGMVIRAGNGRVEVSKELGWSHIPALVVDESEAHAVAYAIADNRTAELAEWDLENLADILVEMKEIDVEGLLDSTGFSGDDLDILLQQHQSDLSSVGESKSDRVAVAPEKFPSYDESIETQYACPRCGYAWSGKADPNG